MLKVKAMSDVISRCELFNKLATIPAPPEANDFKAEVYKVIQQMETTDKWIPCSERLPSEKDYIGDVVIWCTDKSIVGVGWYYESTKSWATIDDTFPPILGKVIAWMPLSEPYREEY
jgi:hypothetical protein